MRGLTAKSACECVRAVRVRVMRVRACERANERVLLRLRDACECARGE